jgi:hypothetical protein
LAALATLIEKETHWNPSKFNNANLYDCDGGIPAAGIMRSRLKSGFLSRLKAGFIKIGFKVVLDPNCLDGLV